MSLKPEIVIYNKPAAVASVPFLPPPSLLYQNTPDFTQNFGSETASSFI